MIHYKRGEYFGYLISAKDAQNLNADFTGTKVRCQIRTLSGVLVHDFGELDLEPDGTALLEALPDVGIRWPVGNLQTDLVYVDAAGRPAATQTIEVRVVKEVTWRAP